MTTYLTPRPSELGAERLSKATIAGYRRRARREFHQAVLQTFQAQAKAVGLRQSTIVKRLDGRADVISRNLGAPGNWEIDTLSDLLLAMNHRPVVLSVPAEADVRALRAKLLMAVASMLRTISPTTTTDAAAEDDNASSPRRLAVSSSQNSSNAI